MADDAPPPNKPVTDAPGSADAGDEQPSCVDDGQRSVEPALATTAVGSATRTARVAAFAAAVAVAGLTGWLVFGAVRAHQVEQQRAMFVAVGRQAALNLTTIDHNAADAAIERILDSSTGAFREDFQQRAEPFVQVVKQFQSDSTGTVTEAGLESTDGDRAQVMVSVSVKTTNPGSGEQPPRLWRMRISLEKTGTSAKVSKVAFVL